MEMISIDESAAHDCGNHLVALAALEPSTFTLYLTRNLTATNLLILTEGLERMSKPCTGGNRSYII